MDEGLGVLLLCGMFFIGGCVGGCEMHEEMTTAEGTVLLSVPPETAPAVAYSGAPELRAVYVSEPHGGAWYVIPDGYAMPKVGSHYDQSEAEAEPRR
jgi:hypothetical protein